MQITVEYEGLDYLALVNPGCPGNYFGHPDTWESPEAEYIEELAVWDPEARNWQIVPDIEAIPISLEDRIWEAADEMRNGGYE
jgi:hypothetical protein